ncbi:Protein transport protein Sec24-like CEF, partial [Diplonema papillatum]
MHAVHDRQQRQPAGRGHAPALPGATGSPHGFVDGGSQGGASEGLSGEGSVMPSSAVGQKYRGRMLVGGVGGRADEGLQRARSFAPLGRFRKGGRGGGASPPAGGARDFLSCLEAAAGRKVAAKERDSLLFVEALAAFCNNAAVALSHAPPSGPAQPARGLSSLSRAEAALSSRPVIALSSSLGQTALRTGLLSAVRCNRIACVASPYVAPAGGAECAALPALVADELFQLVCAVHAAEGHSPSPRALLVHAAVLLLQCLTSPGRLPPACGELSCLFRYAAASAEHHARTSPDSPPYTLVSRRGVRFADAVASAKQELPGSISTPLPHPWAGLLSEARALVSHILVPEPLGVRREVLDAFGFAPPADGGDASPGVTRPLSLRAGDGPPAPPGLADGVARFLAKKRATRARQAEAERTGPRLPSPPPRQPQQQQQLLLSLLDGPVTRQAPQYRRAGSSSGAEASHALQQAGGAACENRLPTLQRGGESGASVTCPPSYHHASPAATISGQGNDPVGGSDATTAASSGGSFGGNHATVGGGSQGGSNAAATTTGSGGSHGGDNAATATPATGSGGSLNGSGGSAANLGHHAGVARDPAALPPSADGADTPPASMLPSIPGTPARPLPDARRASAGRRVVSGRARSLQLTPQDIVPWTRPHAAQPCEQQQNPARAKRVSSEPWPCSAPPDTDEFQPRGRQPPSEEPSPASGHTHAPSVRQKLSAQLRANSARSEGKEVDENHAATQRESFAMSDSVSGRHPRPRLASQPWPNSAQQHKTSGAKPFDNERQTASPREPFTFSEPVSEHRPRSSVAEVQCTRPRLASQPWSDTAHTKTAGPQVSDDHRSPATRIPVIQRVYASALPYAPLSAGGSKPGAGSVPRQRASESVQLPFGMTLAVCAPTHDRARQGHGSVPAAIRAQQDGPVPPSPGLSGKVHDPYRTVRFARRGSSTSEFHAFAPGGDGGRSGSPLMVEHPDFPAVVGGHLPSHRRDTGSSFGTADGELPPDLDVVLASGAGILAGLGFPQSADDEESALSADFLLRMPCQTTTSSATESAAGEHVDSERSPLDERRTRASTVENVYQEEGVEARESSGGGSSCLLQTRAATLGNLRQQNGGVARASNRGGNSCLSQARASTLGNLRGQGRTANDARRVPQAALPGLAAAEPLVASRLPSMSEESLAVLRRVFLGGAARQNLRRVRRAAAVVLQAAVRAHLARAWLRAAGRAAVIIQRLHRLRLAHAACVRCVQLRRSCRARAGLAQAAATRMQKVARGWLFRKNSGSRYVEPSIALRLVAGKVRVSIQPPRPPCQPPVAYVRDTAPPFETCSADADHEDANFGRSAAQPGTPGAEVHRRPHSAGNQPAAALSKGEDPASVLPVRSRRASAGVAGEPGSELRERPRSVGDAPVAALSKGEDPVSVSPACEGRASVGVAGEPGSESRERPHIVGDAPVAALSNAGDGTRGLLARDPGYGTLCEGEAAGSDGLPRELQDRRADASFEPFRLQQDTRREKDAYPDGSQRALRGACPFEATHALTPSAAFALASQVDSQLPGAFLSAERAHRAVEAELSHRHAGAVETQREVTNPDTLRRDSSCTPASGGRSPSLCAPFSAREAAAAAAYARARADCENACFREALRGVLQSAAVSVQAFCRHKASRATLAEKAARARAGLAVVGFGRICAAKRRAAAERRREAERRAAKKAAEERAEAARDLARAAAGWRGRGACWARVVEAQAQRRAAAVLQRSARCWLAAMRKQTRRRDLAAKAAAYLAAEAEAHAAGVAQRAARVFLERRHAADRSRARARRRQCVLLLQNFARRLVATNTARSLRTRRGLQRRAQAAAEAATAGSQKMAAAAAAAAAPAHQTAAARAIQRWWQSLTPGGNPGDGHREETGPGSHSSLSPPCEQPVVSGGSDSKEREPRSRSSSCNLPARTGVDGEICRDRRRVASNGPRSNTGGSLVSDYHRSRCPRAKNADEIVYSVLVIQKSYRGHLVRSFLKQHGAHIRRRLRTGTSWVAYSRKLDHASSHKSPGPHPRSLAPPQRSITPRPPRVTPPAAAFARRHVSGPTTNAPGKTPAAEYGGSPVSRGAAPAPESGASTPTPTPMRDGEPALIAGSSGTPAPCRIYTANEDIACCTTVSSSTCGGPSTGDIVRRLRAHRDALGTGWRAKDTPACTASSSQVRLLRGLAGSREPLEGGACYESLAMLVGLCEASAAEAITEWYKRQLEAKVDATGNRARRQRLGLRSRFQGAVRKVAVRLTAGATVCQRWWRGCRVRRAAAALRNTHRRSMARGLLADNAAHDLPPPAPVCGGNRSGGLPLTLGQEAVVFVHYAAAKVQRAVRRFLSALRVRRARAQQSQRLRDFDTAEQQSWAACVVQRSYRTHRGRMLLRRIRGVPGLLRARITVRRLAQQRCDYYTAVVQAEAVRAASVIQRAWRRRQAVLMSGAPPGAMGHRPANGSGALPPGPGGFAPPPQGVVPTGGMQPPVKPGATGGAPPPMTGGMPPPTFQGKAPPPRGGPTTGSMPPPQPMMHKGAPPPHGGAPGPGPNSHQQPFPGAPRPGSQPFQPQMQGGQPPPGSNRPPQQQQQQQPPMQQGGQPPPMPGNRPPMPGPQGAQQQPPMQQGGQPPPMHGNRPPMPGQQQPTMQGGQPRPMPPGPHGNQQPPVQQGGPPPMPGNRPPMPGPGTQQPPMQGGSRPPPPMQGSQQQGGQPPMPGNRPPMMSGAPQGSLPQQQQQQPPMQGGQAPPMQGNRPPPMQGSQQQQQQPPPAQGGQPPMPGNRPPMMPGAPQGSLQQPPPQMQGGQAPPMQGNRPPPMQGSQQQQQQPPGQPPMPGNRPPMMPGQGAPQQGGPPPPMPGGNRQPPMPGTSQQPPMQGGPPQQGQPPMQGGPPMAGNRPPPAVGANQQPPPMQGGQPPPNRMPPGGPPAGGQPPAGGLPFAPPQGKGGNPPFGAPPGPNRGGFPSGPPIAGAGGKGAPGPVRGVPPTGMPMSKGGKGAPPPGMPAPLQQADSFPGDGGSRGEAAGVVPPSPSSQASGGSSGKGYRQPPTMPPPPGMGKGQKGAFPPGFQPGQPVNSAPSTPGTVSSVGPGPLRPPTPDSPSVPGMPGGKGGKPGMAGGKGHAPQMPGPPRPPMPGTGSYPAVHSYEQTGGAHGPSQLQQQQQQQQGGGGPAVPPPPGNGNLGPTLSSPTTMASPTGGYNLSSPASPNNAPSAVGRKDFRPAQPTSARRLNSKQVPSPVVSTPKIIYSTGSADPPPRANSQYTVIDKGSCSPRFMRTTMYAIPPDVEKLKQVSIPWAVVLAPLASPELGECKPPTVSAPGGPVRCKRCRAFINSEARFVSKGRAWECNLCGVSNTVLSEYFENLDPDGVRTDIDSRPELKFGSVEWDVQDTPDLAYGGNNWSPAVPAPVMPMQQLFVIDVSKTSAHALPSLSSALCHALEEMANDYPQCDVAFMTYASSVHFYDMTKDDLPIYLAPDVDDVFVPLPFNKVCWVKIGAGLQTCLRFAARLVQVASLVNEDGCCVGAALTAAQLVLDDAGGRIMCTCSSYPNVGVGHYKPRDDHKLLAGNKEKEVWSAAPGWWPDFGLKCAKRQVAVDFFVFPQSFVDLVTLGSVAHTTGGQVYLYTNFNPARGYDRLRHQVTRNLTRESGHAGMLIVRCSPGIRVKSYHGDFMQTDPNVIDIAGIDCDKTIFVELEHEGKINAQQSPRAYLQTALLYTRRDGRRRVRVHTLALQVQTGAAVFRGADMDAMLSWMTHKAIHALQTKGINSIRDGLQDSCVEMLAAYRKNCASTAPAGQLILPETLKLTPIFCLSLLKAPCFRPIEGSESIDERTYHIANLRTMRLADLSLYYYPRLFPLFGMPANCGTFDEEKGLFVLPNQEILASDEVRSSGVYLLHDYTTDFIYVWVGERACVKLQAELFDVPNGVTHETVLNFPQLIASTKPVEEGGSLPRWQ